MTGWQWTRTIWYRLLRQCRLLAVAAILVMPPPISTPLALSMSVSYLFSAWSSWYIYCLSTSFTLSNERKSRLFPDPPGYIESTINGTLPSSMDLATSITLRDLIWSSLACQIYRSYKEIALEITSSSDKRFNIWQLWLDKIASPHLSTLLQGHLIQPYNLPKLVPGSVLRFRFIWIAPKASPSPTHQP